MVPEHELRGVWLEISSWGGGAWDGKRWQGDYACACECGS